MPKLFFIALFCASFAPAAAQSFDATTAGGPITINAAWRFHTGDDPQWASPGFDDSQWSLLRIDKTWAAQGYKRYYGFSWYRLKLKLPATRAPLALGFTEINSADEIYADGQMIGSIGKMRPVPVWLGYSPTIHTIPVPPALNGRTIELVIRVWQPQASSNDVAYVGRSSNPQVGNLPTIAALQRISIVEFALNDVPNWILAATGAGIGLCSLGLFLLRRRATEYGWATLFLFDGTALFAGGWFYRTYQWPALYWIFAATCLNAALLIFWLLFIWRFLRAPADNLLRAGIVIMLLVPIPSWMASQGYINVTQANLIWVIAPLVLSILVFARLVRLAWQGNRDAQVLLVPFLLSNLMTVVSEAMDFFYWIGLLQARRGIAYLLFYRGPAFSLSWGWLFALLSNLAVAILLMLRFARTAERDERLSAEMEAAHRVQTQLVPADLPVTPHFRFEAAYLAASEVGGDFYQVFPLPDGSVLVAIGDVSGKGLKAAMLGTLVVGALRTLAQEDLPPSEILARLNQQLVASSNGGFVTCLVLRVSPSGAAVLANAGHLPPYLSGSEIAVENGLPLGLESDTAYPETRFQLPQDMQLTLLSDGVAEARNSSGHLLGFERTRGLSTESAQSIARAASTFGQEDDITVLTLSRTASEHSPAGSVAGPVLATS